MFSIDNKMSVLRMIDTLNANKNVGYVWIRICSSSKWNSEIVAIIANSYTNVYHIRICDYND